jgi:predicted RNA-binding protein with PUA-like domain
MPAKKPNASDRRFWLFKSEPNVYSIHDLAKEERRTTFWDGVRNYQARNSLRDSIQVGDGVLFYHSSVEPMAIVGTANVVRAGYPDHTAFDPKSCHFDPGSEADQPTWFMVDIQLDTIFQRPLWRATLESCPELKKMVLLQRGSRLSIQPVTASEWNAVLRLAKESR